jgi:hypothetical protein
MGNSRVRGVTERASRRRLRLSLRRQSLNRDLVHSAPGFMESSAGRAVLGEPPLAHRTKRVVVPAPDKPEDDGGQRHDSANDEQHVVHARPCRSNTTLCARRFGVATLHAWVHDEAWSERTPSAAPAHQSTRRRAKSGNANPRRASICSKVRTTVSANLLFKYLCRDRYSAGTTDDCNERGSVTLALPRKLSFCPRYACRFRDGRGTPDCPRACPRRLRRGACGPGSAHRCPDVPENLRW